MMEVFSSQLKPNSLKTSPTGNYKRNGVTTLKSLKANCWKIQKNINQRNRPCPLSDLKLLSHHQEHSLSFFLVPSFQFLLYVDFSSISFTQFKGCDIFLTIRHTIPQIISLFYIFFQGKKVSVGDNLKPLLITIYTFSGGKFFLLITFLLLCSNSQERAKCSYNHSTFYTDGLQ